jgi:hypothetical protein
MDRYEGSAERGRPDRGRVWTRSPVEVAAPTWTVSVLRRVVKC